MNRRRALKLLAIASATAIAHPLIKRQDQTALAAQLSLSRDDIYWLVSLAFLKMLAQAEGVEYLRKEAYKTTYRYRKFDSFDDHPRIDIPIPGDYLGRTSDAAGPYQILSTTWDRTRREYPDIWLTNEPSFSPANQDRCALALCDRTRTTQALLSGTSVLNGHLTVSYASFKKAIYRASREWASLPGHDIGKDSGQHTKPLHYLWTAYQWYLWGQCGYRRAIAPTLPTFDITSHFGPRWGDFHGGIDLAASVGTPVSAPERSVVVKVEEDRRSGKYVVLSPEGYPELEISFCHLSRSLVTSGEVVEKGATFALSGATGKVTGPHLHLGMWADGGLINPYKYLMMSEWFKEA